MSDVNGRQGMGCVALLAVLLGVLFIGLKLAGVIAWSWLWVLAPLWIYASLSVLIFLVALVILVAFDILADRHFPRTNTSRAPPAQR